LVQVFRMKIPRAHTQYFHDDPPFVIYNDSS
jgi:hypothetical protein